jgi:hypothetical protein
VLYSKLIFLPCLQNSFSLFFFLDGIAEHSHTVLHLLPQDKFHNRKRVIKWFEGNLPSYFHTFLFCFSSADILGPIHVRLDHFLVAFPLRSLYETGIKQRRNVFRWIRTILRPAPQLVQGLGYTLRRLGLGLGSLSIRVCDGFARKYTGVMKWNSGIGWLWLQTGIRYGFDIAVKVRFKLTTYESGYSPDVCAVSRTVSMYTSRRGVSFQTSDGSDCKRVSDMAGL